MKKCGNMERQRHGPERKVKSEERWKHGKPLTWAGTKSGKRWKHGKTKTWAGTKSEERWKHGKTKTWAGTKSEERWKHGKTKKWARKKSEEKIRRQICLYTIFPYETKLTYNEGYEE